MTSTENRDQRSEGELGSLHSPSRNLESNPSVICVQYSVICLLPSARYALLSYLKHNSSSRIPGGATTKEHVAAAGHDDLLDPLDNQTPGSGSLRVSEYQRATVVVHLVNIDTQLIG